MIPALVLTHGGIGGELVDVVQMILGPVPGLEAASNRGLSANQTTELVEAWLAAREPGQGGLVFIDEHGGSCASAARLAGTEAAGVPILSGVNLAMLLAFVTWREESPPDELVQRIVDHGRKAIAVVGAVR
jgi:mannose/fructose-specific phosphotransferase system component IIA